MAELTLDHERHALACELDGVGVAQLVRREAAPDPAWAASRRNSTRTLALDQGRPRVGPSMTQNGGPTGTGDGQAGRAGRPPPPRAGLDRVV